MSSALRSTLCTAVAASAVAFGGIACSTPTAVTNEWKDPSYAAGPMRNVMVVGAKLDDTPRRTLEDSFASNLSMHGIRATASDTLFPGQLPDRSQVQAAVQKEGFDGVLISTMRGVHEQTVIEPGAGWGGGFYDGYWGSGWAGSGAYVQTDQFVKFETTLWDPTGPGKLVWSAVTQTENPTSGQNFASSLTKKLVPDMAKKGLIPPTSGQRVSSARASQ
jgi:hypothetical protein